MDKSLVSCFYWTTVYNCNVTVTMEFIMHPLLDRWCITELNSSALSSTSQAEPTCVKFLPARRYASVVFATATCLSVCLSVTRRY